MNELRQRIVAVTAAAAFNQNLHPRGAGGKYIVVGGTVDTLGPTGQPVGQGTVKGIDPNTGVITVQDNKTGQTSQLPPNKVTSAPTHKAYLTPATSAPGPGATGQVPIDPAQAKYQGMVDALMGKPPLTSGDPRALYAYTQAYQREKARTTAQKQRDAARAARIKAAAAKKAARLKAAAAKKAAAKKKSGKSGGGGSSGYIPYHSSSPAGRNVKSGTHLGA